VRLASRSRRQAATMMFPGNYWVFRHLSLRVPEGGVISTSVPLSVASRLAPRVADYMSAKAAADPTWRAFGNVDVDRLDLAEPIGVQAEVQPTTWWCASCGRVYNGAIGTVGVRGGTCPNCRRHAVLQFGSFFLCPECHTFEPVSPPSCGQCGDSRSVTLSASGGRRRTYRWRCEQHPQWEMFVRRDCRSDGARMALKAAGGRTYYEETLVDINFQGRADAPLTRRGLRFLFGRASVSEVVLGRRPVADVGNFFRRLERPRVEPFVNPITGRLTCFVSVLQTDALQIEGADGPLGTVLAHSVKHALLNAAPAVTGLTQDEFGASLEDENGARLVLYDGVAGGTGGCRMLGGSRLDRWLSVARELAECHQVECDDACRGCLFLPQRACRRGNQDLNRFELLDLWS
jgi:hypothetical protein